MPTPNIGLSFATATGAESGGPFDFDAPIVFGSQTQGPTSQNETQSQQPTATATAMSPTPTGVGGVSPNPNSFTGAIPQTVNQTKSNAILWIGLIALAGLGVWLITKK